ncbi:MAG TPA: hypothetical protein VFE47_20420 [Tepidisphaeraceae bacterium]|jgi:hypothetical protein|nr:hypothetical protein [Tepidisphaeraceae bacterium]
MKTRLSPQLPNTLLLSIAALLITALQTSAAQPPTDPIANLKPGEWYEVPDSHLEKVAPSQQKFPWLRGGVYAETACWAGGAFDTQRDRLYLGPGGGHAGYNGNEIYAFDLNDLKWHRINDPDPVIPGTEYTDLNKCPFAMHTYDGVEYIPPPVDRYVVVGGWNTPLTYALDPDHPDHWEVYPGHGTGRTGDICGYDAVSQLLYFSTPSTAGKTSQWDPITHHWTLRTLTSPEPSYYETADVDYKRHLLVSCGKGKVKVWHLAPIPQRITMEEIQTTGDTEILDRCSPGFCYVPCIDRFVAWASGPEVYTLDIDSKKWTKHAPAATNTVLPGKPDQWGTFGRFRYVPSKNVFVVYNDVKQDVYIYRLTADVPNIITGVEASLKRPAIESDIPAAALSVRAIYADGSRKDVTSAADYFSLDPAVAQAEVHGGGVIKGLAGGNARIRAVYSDPAFKRGYAAEIVVPVHSLIAQSTLDAVRAEYPKLTIVAGDSFPLHAEAAYTRGADHFKRDCSAQAKWTSDAPEIASINGGSVKGLHPGSAKFTTTFNGKSDIIDVTVVATPIIHRISFGVKDTSPRDGWNADNGKPFTADRGFGWLNPTDLSLRDDRNSAKHLLLKSFVKADEKQFKVAVPPGHYAVKIAMGDHDYGGIPFDYWTALGHEKLVYYEGHDNNAATRIVQAGDDGLVFTVNGPINYMIIAPVGIDLEMYANDGP